MPYLGEIISLAVAFSWTATALLADLASHRIGAQTLNFIRMVLSLLLLAALLWIVTGHPYPAYADGQAWFWLAMSGLVGYVFGDFCLFNSYMVMGSRFGQLFMTLAPPVSGIAGYFLLGEQLGWKSWIAMAVTLAGIAMTILVRGGGGGVKLNLPWKGVLLGIGAGIGQGLGLVLSKIGLDCYAAALPAEVSASMGTMLPFAGTFIRAVFGMAGFALVLLLQKDFGSVGRAFKDGKGMKYAFLTTMFGPFLGVSLSLMAVQYAKAGIASTLMALTPVLIILPYSIIYKQKVRLKEVIGTLVTVAGVALFFLLT
jgi:drug/metabolite transporter (DMT)-like permease